MNAMDTTLNTADAVANSSMAADKPVFDPDSIGIVNTVTDATDAPSTADKTEDTSDKTLKHDDDHEDQANETAKNQDTRFDKHPDWQRMIREREEARQAANESRQEAQRIKEERIRLEAERDFLKNLAAPAKTESLPYKDTSQMSSDELADWMSTDPKGYHDNLIIQARELAKREVESVIRQRDEERSRISKEERIKKTYDDYEAANPDFKIMWDSGEILRFLDANPGHNPISAHQLMTAERRIAEARSQAAKETEEKINKNWQAKRQASVIGGGPSTIPSATGDEELQNTKTRGGPVAVLTARLLKMRRDS